MLPPFTGTALVLPSAEEPEESQEAMEEEAPTKPLQGSVYGQGQGWVRVKVMVRIRATTSYKARARARASARTRGCGFSTLG